MNKQELINYFKNVLNDKTKITDQRGNEVIVFTRNEVEQILKVLETEEPRLLTYEEMTKLKSGTDSIINIETTTSYPNVMITSRCNIYLPFGK